MTHSVRPLSEYLEELTDPRKARGLRHPLTPLLSLCVVAMMCGAKTPKAVANWIKYRPELLARLGFNKSYGPSKSTLYRMLALVSVEDFIACVERWLEENLDPLLQSDTAEDLISLDGKTLRGSCKQGAAVSHLLSAFSQRLQRTIAQLSVDDKTNEITIAPELLADLVLTGRIFIMDALLTQREIAQTIVDGGGDYVMFVKENQPTLYQDIATLFEPEECAPGFSPALKDFRTAQAVSKGHGRMEYRTLQASVELNDYLDWPGVQQVFQLERRTIILKTGQERQERVYGVTSLPPERAEAERLLQVTRIYWQIENRSHWVRDVTFGEDHSQVRKGTLPQMLAALRNVVIGLLRHHRFRFIPDGWDFFSAHPSKALAAIGC